MSVFITAASAEYEKHKNISRENINTHLNILSSNMSGIIQSRIINAHAMAALLEIKSDFTQEDFEIFAKKFYDEGNLSLKSIVFIEDTTIAYIYPYELYKASLGANLADISEQKELIEFSKNTGKSVITPKVKLVEGSDGIVIRVPIFVKDAYKGQISMTFNYDLLMNEIGVDNHKHRLFTKIDITNQMDNVPVEIYSDFKDHPSKSYMVEKNFKLEDSAVTIYATSSKPFQQISFLNIFLIVFGFIFSLTLSISLYKQLKLKEDIIVANKQLNKLMIHDDLTGLLNRRAFFEDMTKNISQSKTGTIINLDIDGFKYINDLYGHNFGDNLLIECSNFFQNKFVDRGTLYRIGGDEFALVIFHGTLEDNDLAALTNFLNDALNGLTKKHNVSFSVGSVTFPKDGMDIKSLFLRIDLALQHSKKQVGNIITPYCDDFLSAFSKKTDIEMILRSALANEGFEIYYQPIFHSNPLSVDSFEALIRLKSKAYGPDEFIPIAEETQLIIPLGYWIIEGVLKHIVDLNIKRNGPSDSYSFFGKSIAINISSVQLYDPKFIPTILQMLDTYHIEPSTIEFEITESVFLHENSELNASINQLRSLGILISLDDFGTGFSSLNYLTYLPLDIVKLDKSVKDKFIEEKFQRVLSGMITMIHGLDMKVVVEGVESQEEQDILTSLSADYLQGYHLCRPVAYDQLYDILFED